MKPLYRNLLTPLLGSIMLTTLAACGGGSTGDGDTSPTATPESVLDQLSTLGIDTRTTPRLDTDGDALPDAYAPLGSSQAINRFAEIMLFGTDADDTRVAQSGNKMTITNLVPAANNSYNWETLNDTNLNETPWFTDTSIRAAVSGDFDNDGIDEVAIAYQLPGQDVVLQIKDDARQGFSMVTKIIIDNNSWDNLFMTSGDYDGNGTEDLVVGMVSPAGTARLVMINNDNGVLALTGKQINFSSQTYNISHLALASGNLDYDNAEELAVVVNEGDLTSSNRGVSANHRYFIYDDALNNFTEMRSGKIVADNGAGTTQAQVGNVAIGDIDGDSIDEVVLAGLDRVGGDSQSNNTPYNYIIQVLDDAKRNFREMTNAVVDSKVSMIRQGSGDYHAMSYAQVVTADLDGDGADEFAVNQFIYNSQRTSPNSLTRFDDDGDSSNGYAEIPLASLMKVDGTSGSFNYNWTTSAFAVADVTSDRRDNILVYSQRSGTTINDIHALEVWGIDQIDGWKTMAYYQTKKHYYTTPQKPQILVPDLELDDGSAALKYDAGSHQLLFTEPMIIAALAAAPCANDLGQDTSGSCRTAFGSAISDTTQITDGWNISTAAHVGYEGEVSVFGATAGVKVMADITTKLRKWKTDTYTTTKTVVRETGSLEDSVILTVLPIDVYSYSVVSHPDPNLVGSIVQVRMPRDIITTMVTLDYYNTHVATPTKRLPQSVFRHTVGDPMSYPTASEKDGILSSGTGLETDVLTVGVGTGQTIATISDFSSTSDGQEFEINANLTVLATAGVDTPFAEGEVLGGFSIGGGGNTAFEISHGTENIYQGSVGNISAAAFNAGKSYSWGMFAYIYDTAMYHQPFEVINYWVE